MAAAMLLNGVRSTTADCVVCSKPLRSLSFSLLHSPPTPPSIHDRRPHRSVHPMGNAPSSWAPSGVLTFTLCHLNAPPVMWVCGVLRDGYSALSMSYLPVRLFSPFGAGSESSVLISQLRVEPTSLKGRLNSVLVRCTFDGSHAVEAEMEAPAPQSDTTFGYNGWSGVFPGPNGPRVLMIDFKSAKLSESYGEQISAGPSR